MERHLQALVEHHRVAEELAGAVGIAVDQAALTPGERRGPRRTLAVLLPVDGDVPVFDSREGEEVGDGMFGLGDGMIEVSLAPSAFDFELLRAEGIDRGIFEVIERRR